MLLHFPTLLCLAKAVKVKISSVSIQWRKIGLLDQSKLSLCFNQAPHHEGVLGEWMYNSSHSLTSAVDGDEWSASLPGRFIPKERAPGTHWIGSWVGPDQSKCQSQFTVLIKLFERTDASLWSLQLIELLMAQGVTNCCVLQILRKVTKCIQNCSVPVLQLFGGTSEAHLTADMWIWPGEQETKHQLDEGSLNIQEV
jgi:hypothetical protein